MTEKVAAFACSHSPTLPELLSRLNCSIALSTYQAGKVVILSALNQERLIQLPRSFQKPMGIAADASRLGVATRMEVMVYNNASRMAANYPPQPRTYDALYLPRATYNTGEVDIHDLHWVGERLLAVNTRFSCLSWIDHRYSFTPHWKPYFISKLAPEDRCHLNGLAFENGQPRYATALGASDEPEGWRKNKTTGGIVIDVIANKLLFEGLGMPHSPRLYDGKLFVLESATGKLVKIDPASGTREDLVDLKGFARGMDREGDFLFIGLSKIRKGSDSFQDLPVSSSSTFSGVVVVHMPTWRVVAHLQYDNSVEEIYDVRVLRGMRRPGLVSALKVEHRLALTTPDEDYWAMVKDDVNDEPRRDSQPA